MRATVKLKYPGQVDMLLKTGRVYVLRCRGRVGMATVSYNNIDLGVCYLTNVGKIRRSNGEIYVDCKGDLKPLSNFVKYSGIDKETWIRLGENILRGAGSRAMLCKVELVKVYGFSRKLIEDMLHEHEER